MPSNDAQFKEIVTDMLDECCRAGTNRGFAASAYACYGRESVGEFNRHEEIFRAAMVKKITLLGRCRLVIRCTLD
jgi:hypothetical protein